MSDAVEGQCPKRKGGMLDSQKNKRPLHVMWAPGLDAIHLCTRLAAIHTNHLYSQGEAWIHSPEMKSSLLHGQVPFLQAFLLMHTRNSKIRRRVCKGKTIKDLVKKASRDEAPVFSRSLTVWLLWKWELKNLHTGVAANTQIGTQQKSGIIWELAWNGNSPSHPRLT